jgi:hypothetical protein
MKQIALAAGIGLGFTAGPLLWAAGFMLTAFTFQDIGSVFYLVMTACTGALFARKIW